MPGHPEPQALLALMLLHDARREARVRADGSVVLLEEQDRRRWNKESIREGWRSSRRRPNEAAGTVRSASRDCGRTRASRDRGANRLASDCSLYAVCCA